VFVLFAYAGALWNAYTIMPINYMNATMMERITVYAPLSLNLAWASLACILNFSNTTMNDKLDFNKGENRTAIGGPDWAMGVIMLASLIASYVSVVRGDFIYALGTVWALQGVRRQQTQGSGFPHSVSPKVHALAHTLSIIVAVMAIIGLLRACFTRKPFAKQADHAVQDGFQREREDPVLRELKARFVPLNDSS
jgi:hypothetical protein